MHRLGSFALLSALVLCALALPACARREVVMTAMADTDTELRARAEFERLSAGVADGRIDTAEAERLAQVMARIEQYRQRAFSDGLLSLREQRRLRRYEARFDRAITVALTR